MRHHLFDESDPLVVVRPATIEDAFEIAQLSTGDLPLSDAALDASLEIVAERLSIPSGDDYFTIVAEHREQERVVGWLSGGGCRGQDRKGWGEIYAYSTERSLPSTLVDEALVAVAVNALKQAQFTGVTLAVDADDGLRRELFEDFGFAAEVIDASDAEPSTDDATDARTSKSHLLVRYSVTFIEEQIGLSATEATET